jgi:MipA family protein
MHRIGLQAEAVGIRGELFLRRRFDGFADFDNVPESMTGMAKRSGGDDVGLAFRTRVLDGALYGELLQDISEKSHGRELRLGYRYEAFWSGLVRWRPYVTLAWRDEKLNNYYFGVRPEEATAQRPAYEAGAGLNVELGVLGSYQMTERWQLLAAAGATRWPGTVRSSPVVEDRAFTPHAMVGLLYAFKPDQPREWDRRPLIMRLGYGQSSDCDLAPIIHWQCLSVNTQDDTSIVKVDVGQVLVHKVNGWPLDIAGFVGFVKHEERGLQEDFWEVNWYLKPIYYFGPWWRDRLRTRLGFGWGISYASRIPHMEQRDQAIRGRDTSKLLLYLDPTLDINIGDLFRNKELKETYLGIGVSHRSGIFGTSRLFDSVDGGSNYIYGFVETGF